MTLIFGDIQGDISKQFKLKLYGDIQYVFQGGPKKAINCF